MLVFNMNLKESKRGWNVGAGQVDLTPAGSPYLCGYPESDRFAESVNDPLLASAVCFESPGGERCLLVSCDLLQLPRELLWRARRRIAAGWVGDPGAAVQRILVAATHTHSGPLTVTMATNPPEVEAFRPDPAYLARVEDGIVAAAEQAVRSLRPAEVASAVADAAGLGSNRHDPAGPSDPRVPVIVGRDSESGSAIAVVAICTMHPTVLHGDSRCVSGDFPGLARAWLQREVVGPDCPLVYFMGAAGNQSPRHVLRDNTLAEAERLGEQLGRGVAAAIQRAEPWSRADLRCRSAEIDLPIREVPSREAAQRRVVEAEQRLRSLVADHAPRAEWRTAEVDWIGARKRRALAEAATAGRLDPAIAERLPAEIQVIRLGPHRLVGWPGEVFVEFALDLQRTAPDASVITLANGELHGYLVTAKAIKTGCYEAAHGLFESPASGRLLVEATRKLIEAL
jgi:hypothetical protein